MKHAVIAAHPKADSFTLTITNAYKRAVEELHHTVMVRDLYKEHFDPCLRAEEVISQHGFKPAADVVAERKLLADVDVFVFVYPLWFNTPPAILKGYIDRVFSMGFGFNPGPFESTPLLQSRKLLSFSSSGASKDWVIDTGAWKALHTLFDEHVAFVCGLELIDHVHFGNITPGITPEAVKRCVSDVRETVAKYF